MQIVCLNPAVLVHVRSGPLFPLGAISVPPTEEVCLFAFKSFGPGNDFDL